jgi:cytochrome b561
VTSTPLRVATIEFSLFELPYPFAPDIERFRPAHAAALCAGAIGLSTLIALHGAAAFVHAWVWRDRALIRMCCEPAELLTHFVASKPVNLDTSEASDRVA